MEFNKNMKNSFKAWINMPSSSIKDEKIRSFTLSGFGEVGPITIIVSLFTERFQDYIMNVDYGKLLRDISEEHSNKI